MARHARPAQVAGRHRLSTAGRVHCRALPAVEAALTTMLASSRRSRAGLSWFRTRPLGGRHSWAWLTQTGGRPKTAFALMLGL